MSDNDDVEALLLAASGLSEEDDRVAALEAQVKALQTTVANLTGSDCAHADTTTFVDGRVACEDCGINLLEGKTLPEADIWSDVQVKAAVLLGAADLDQLAQAHADLTDLLLDAGVIRDDPQPIDLPPDVDPVSALAARRIALEG